MSRRQWGWTSDGLWSKMTETACQMVEYLVYIAERNAQRIRLSHAFENQLLSVECRLRENRFISDRHGKTYDITGHLTCCSLLRRMVRAMSSTSSFTISWDKYRPSPTNSFNSGTSSDRASSSWVRLLSRSVWPRKASPCLIRNMIEETSATSIRRYCSCCFLKVESSWTAMDVFGEWCSANTQAQMTTGFCVDLEPVQRLFPVVEAFGDEGFFTSFDARRVFGCSDQPLGKCYRRVYVEPEKRRDLGLPFRLTRKMTHFAIGQPLVRSKPS